MTRNTGKEKDPTKESGKTGKEIAELLESNKRNLTGWQFWVIAGIALAASFFHLYTAAFGLFFAMKQRAIHWMMMGTIVFLLYPFSKKRPRDKIDIWDWALAALLIAGCLNILMIWGAITAREGRAIPSDIYMGVIMTILVIETTRRTVGWPLPIVALTAISYAVFGRYLPGMLKHPGFPISELAPFMYLRTPDFVSLDLGNRMVMGF